MVLTSRSGLFLFMDIRYFYADLIQRYHVAFQWIFKTQR